VVAEFFNFTVFLIKQFAVVVEAAVIEVVTVIGVVAEMQY
jgi:hypothetical protein